MAPRPNALRLSSGVNTAQIFTTENEEVLEQLKGSQQPDSQLSGELHEIKYQGH